MSFIARTREEWSALALDRGFQIVNLQDRIKELEAELTEKNEWNVELDELNVRLMAQIAAVKECQRYTAESFAPKTQFIQFTTQPYGEVMLTKDVLAALEQSE